MKDTARKTTRRQEATAQLAFAAMLDARATLHDAIVSAGMGVLAAMLEEERVKLCGPRYAHQPGRSAMQVLLPVPGEWLQAGPLCLFAPRNVQCRAPGVIHFSCSFAMFYKPLRYHQSRSPQSLLCLLFLDSIETAVYARFASARLSDPPHLLPLPGFPTA